MFVKAIVINCDMVIFYMAAVNTVSNYCYCTVKVIVLHSRQISSSFNANISNNPKATSFLVKKNPILVISSVTAQYI